MAAKSNPTSPFATADGAPGVSFAPGTADAVDGKGSLTTGKSFKLVASPR